MTYAHLHTRPDHCDGTYDASCDYSRNHRNITKILEAFEKIELLADMKTYWKAYRGADEYLWQHEWTKHGTCISTLNTECYGANYEPTQEVPDFFQKAVDLFKTLPSYGVSYAFAFIKSKVLMCSAVAC